MIKKFLVSFILLIHFNTYAQTPKKYLSTLIKTATSYQELCQSFGTFLQEQESNLTEFIDMLKTWAESTFSSDESSTESEEEDELDNSENEEDTESEEDEESDEETTYSQSESEEEEGEYTSTESEEDETDDKEDIIFILKAMKQTLQELSDILLLNNNMVLAARFTAAFTKKAKVTHSTISEDDLDFTEQSQKYVTKIDTLICSIENEEDLQTICEKLLGQQDVLTDIAGHVKFIGGRLSNENLIINLQRLDY